MIMYILIILTILAIIFLLFIKICSEIALNKAFYKKKKNKEDAFNSLRKRGILDESIYNKFNFQDVSIISKDNLILKGHLIENYKDSNNYIILVHGYTANYHIHIPFVPLFIKEGFNILLVDERSHGESQGDFLSYGYFERDDLDLWINYLEKRKGQKLFLGLHGQSMGAATVLMCGARNPKVRFIIEDCGYNSAKEIIKDQCLKKMKFMPFKFVYYLLRKKVQKLYNFDLDKVTPMEDILKSDVPILFIHGNSDDYVPCRMSEEMYKKRKNPKDDILIVEKADHLMAYDLEKEEYERKVHDFIEKVRNTV